MHTETPRRAWAGRAAYGLGLAALFALVLWAGLWRNGFPSAWHNDEPGKIQQVRQGTRNFHHPPLLLEIVTALANLTGSRSDPEAIARLGRGVSAVCLAASAVGLALLGRRLAGPGAGLLAGAALGSHPLLVECAHYFKEDALHLLGLVAALLAGQAFADSPRSRSRAVFLGLALAFCAAGKHSGWLLLGVMGAVGAWLLWRRRQEVEAPDFRLALGVFLGAYALLCAPMLLQLPTAWGEILWELRKLGGGDYGVGVKTPHALYLWSVYNDYGWTGAFYLGGLLLAGLAGLFWRPRTQSWTVSVLSAYSLIYLIALAFTAKFSERYAIPLILAASLGLALGAAALGKLLAARFPRRRWAAFAGPALGLAAALILLAPARTHDLRQRLAGFASDSHADLARYIRHHTPPGTVIAADSMALGAKPALGARRALLTSWFAADLGTLEDLANRGVNSIAFSRDVAHRYYETDWARQVLAGQDTRPLDRHRVDFYGTLSGQQPANPAKIRTRLLWSSPARDPKPLHPGLYLVELIPATDSPPETPEALTISK